MNCPNCKDQKHDICKKENEGRAYPSCDCQHRVEQKTIVEVDDGQVTNQPAAGAA